MKVNEDDIRQVAQVSKLALTEDEVKYMMEDIQASFQYVADKLSALDTEHVCDMDQVTTNKNVFRDDVCKDSLEREEILRNASEKENGYFKVPKVMEGN